MQLSLTKSLAGVLTVLLSTACLWAAELQEFKDVRYVADTGNDGDSFLVELAGERHRVRLYYVDCIESVVDAESGARRVREQMRYFGLANAAETVRFGVESKEFAAEILAKPFTVHTAFASAGGRSVGGRVYGFVTLSSGEDMGRLLVAKGYARARGIGRRTPGGVHRDEMKEYLNDLEIAAAIKRVGVWAKTDPDRLVELRKQQRFEDRELAAVKREVDDARAVGLTRGKSPGKPIDINRATQKQLEQLPGVGPATARQIIAGRPYKTVDDLLKVSGIGPGILAKLRVHVLVDK